MTTQTDSASKLKASRDSQTHVYDLWLFLRRMPGPMKAGVYKQLAVTMLCLGLSACGYHTPDNNDSSADNNSQSLDTTPVYSLGGSVSGLSDGKLLTGC